MTLWKWYYSDNHQGTEATYDAAVEAMERHLSFAVCDAWEDYSPDGLTTYFYETEDAREEDEYGDGAYTPSITVVPMEARA